MGYPLVKHTVSHVKICGGPDVIGQVTLALTVVTPIVVLLLDPDPPPGPTDRIGHRGPTAL
jgi:hypothetical protein